MALSNTQAGNIEEEVANEEEIYSYLAAEQAAYQANQQIAEVYKEGTKYKHPSYFKYGILFSLAVIVDVLDFIDLTGFGLIIARAISLLVSAIIIFILWFTDTKYKQAQEYIDTLDEKLKLIQSNLAHTTRMLVRTGKILRRIPQTRRLGNRLIKTLAQTRRFARRNPITKFLFFAVANLIPFLSLFTWMTVGIYLSYRDEKKTYQNAREAATDAYQQLTPETV